jgi:hypothetical protein
MLMNRVTITATTHPLTPNLQPMRCVRITVGSRGVKLVFGSLFCLSMSRFGDNATVASSKSSSLGPNGASPAAEDMSKWLSRITSEHECVSVFWEGNKFQKNRTDWSSKNVKEASRALYRPN